MNSNLQKDLKRKFNKTLKRLSFVDTNINKKRAIVWDKICPKCKNFIFGNNNFCTCGYSAAKERLIKLWGLIVFTWFFIIVSTLFIFNNFSALNSVVYQKFEKSDSDFYSLSPASVQIITSLRYSKYKDYIQTIYVNPKEKHKLMVLIKPVYWDILPLKEKESLKQTVLKKWDNIYKNTNPLSKFKPEVQLANFQ